MADDRDFFPEDEEPFDEESLDTDLGDADLVDDTLPESAYAAVSEFDAEFDSELDAELDEAEADLDEVQDYAAQAYDDAPDEFALVPLTSSTPSPALDDEERLRQPRAAEFRRRLRRQIGMLPLALFLLVLGGFLIARAQDVSGLPDLSTLALAEIAVLVVGFTMLWQSLLSGRRERGLIFVGLLVWVTAVMVGVLVYGMDEQPDPAEWWPLLLWSVSLTLVLTYLIERTHDARLLLLSVVILVAGTTAYAVTSDRLDRDLLNDVADYWPLLLSLAGIGLLPLAVRRRTERETYYDEIPDYSD
ncbi:MAG: hypothetical protein JXQ72_07560 [Anaerolineae bacterium]|nr:hypothetical protein [Anaerolineae bacterium]